MNIKHPRVFFIVFLFIVFMLVGNPVSAHTSGLWLPGEPVVPCGGPDQPECTQCELFHLVRHVIDFLMIAATPILATFFFIVAGVFLMLGGANPGMLSTGKSIFKNTFIGILIVMLAWLITNTIIRTLADPNALSGNWYEFSCPFEN